MMYVGVLKLKLQVQDSQNLKMKRRVVQSLCERLRKRFPVSVSEVGDQDSWQMTVIGVVVVNSNSKITVSYLDKILKFIEENSSDYQVISEDRDIQQF